MSKPSLTPLALRQHLDVLEVDIPGYWIDGPYPPTSKGGISNWQAIAYPKGRFDMTGLRQAKRQIEELKARQPAVIW